MAGLVSKGFDPFSECHGFSPKNTALFSVIIKGSWVLNKGRSFFMGEIFRQNEGRRGGQHLGSAHDEYDYNLSHLCMEEEDDDLPKATFFWGRDMLYSSLEGNPQNSGIFPDKPSF